MLAKFGFIVLLCLGICIGLGYDRRPPIAYRLQFLPFIHPTIRLAGGPLTVARAGEAATAVILNTCHANVSTLGGALDRQSAAVAALRTQSQAWVAQGQRQVLAARVVADSYRRNATAILALPEPAVPDACAAADALILKEAGQ